jgi:hypothetical protein
LVLQAFATKTGVAHHLAVPFVRREAVIHGLRQAIPGLLVEAIDQPMQDWNSQWIIWMSTRRRPLQTTEPESLARSLITALSGVHGTEALALTWVLGPVRRPIAVPSRAHSGHADSWQQYILAHGELEYHWRVEVDLATEHASTLRRKCEQYLRYWQSGAGADDAEVFPRVAWLTTTAARADRIREVAEQVQGEVPLFEVGLIDRPLEVLLPDRGSA